METLRIRVQRGAELLDETVPDWAERVLETIEMSSTRCCILGQVFKAEAQEWESSWNTGYHEGLSLLHLNTDRAGANGFTSFEEDGEGRWEELNMRWRRQVAVRIHSDKAMRFEVRDFSRTLDRIKPGWWSLIDFDSIEMMNPHRCIFGQVFSREALASLAGPHDYASGYGYAYENWPALRGDAGGSFHRGAEYLWQQEVAKREAEADGHF